MPNDKGVYGPKLRVPGASVYRDQDSLLPLRPLTTAHFAECLPVLFPWISVEGWENLPPTIYSDELGDLQDDVDTLALFPTRAALLRQHRGGSGFSAELHVATEQVRSVVRRIDTHYFAGDSRHIRRNERTEAAMGLIDRTYNLYHTCDVYRLPIQLGHRWDGYTPGYAERFFEKSRALEFGLDLTHVIITLAVHKLVYDYVPLMSIHCTGSMFDAGGGGDRYSDSARVDGLQGWLMNCCWNWTSLRPRAMIGAATGFIRPRLIVP